MVGKRMPVVFIGHGSPMNVIEDNEFTRGWKEIADKIPKPKAILCISAHWVTECIGVTAMKEPKTIHDFYGFPKKLYDMTYPAPGSPVLAKRVKEIIKSVDVMLDTEWGLDHGTWSVLKVMYPKADIPVLQLSINALLPLSKHYELGKELEQLREEGVLIVGSGNIVHNLMKIDFEREPYPWAVDFDNFVKSALEEKDSVALINYTKQKSAQSALPTNEHFIPLLYVLGASGNENPVFFNTALTLASLSMRCVIYSI